MLVHLGLRPARGLLVTSTLRAGTSKSPGWLLLVDLSWAGLLQGGRNRRDSSFRASEASKSRCHPLASWPPQHPAPCVLTANLAVVFENQKTILSSHFLHGKVEAGG